MEKLSYYFVLIFLFVFSAINSIAGQVGINTSSSPPDPSSMLDIESTNKGLLVPRMTESERDNINNPSHSLLVFQIDGNTGFYFNSGTPVSPVWIQLASASTDGPIRIPIDTLPFIINTPGSYFLTATLNAPTGANGITITASQVTIDLNGNGLISDGSGAHTAIQSSGSINHVSIYNGYISNWGAHGINLASSNSASLSHIQIDGSGYAGFNLGVESLVSNCTATNNGLDGISANNSSTVINCHALNNGADGIDVSSYCSISNSKAQFNQGNGIEAGATCMVKDCIASDNTDNGIYTGAGALVTGCISTNNTLSGYELLTGSKSDNNQSRSNSQNGFLISNDVTITNCLADNNSFSGFLCDGSDARIDNNQSTDNSQHGFSITGTGNVIIRNTSSGNLSLPFNIIAGNVASTILTSANINSNSNPYANIAF
jgi:hypothetical protein